MTTDKYRSKNQEITYSAPREAPEDEPLPKHIFEIIENGESIAGAELDYYSRPLPLYQITDVWSDHANQGNASKVMNAVETFLHERKRPGVLVDAIPDDSPARGMYERRGWRAVPSTCDLYTYNWPINTPLGKLTGYALRQTAHELRTGRG